MKLRTSAFISLVATTLITTGANADWNPGDGHKMHYPQLPDLTSTGMDINATFRPSSTGGGGVFPFVKILADDFRCSETGPINDIHIWGSWLNDQVFTGTQFKLSIHADIPASPTAGGYSRPGAQLWSNVFTPGQYVQRPYASTQGERFWDPNTNQFLGTDNTVWQYNFTNIPNPFTQTKGVVYWLDVQALAPQPFVFGWKTTNPLQTPHFLDDAVYGDTEIFAGPPIPQFPNPSGEAGLLPWRDMHYPDGPFAPQSIDLAFVITPEPISLASIAFCGLIFMRRK